LGAEFRDWHYRASIYGQSRQILFEGSQPKPRTYMDSFGSPKRICLQ
jgi:hypothetical protein